MKCYKYAFYNITLDAPAIITSLHNHLHSSVTLPYILGSALRGVVARALGDPENDPTRLAEFRSLVLGEAVRYLNAYPLFDERRSLPVPVSIRRCKYDSWDDTRVHAYDLSAEDDWPEDQLSALGQPFFTIGAADLILVGSEVSSRVHHQRDRIKGRAWKDDDEKTHGAIFVYESLDADQSFSGCIQVFGSTMPDCDNYLKRVKDKLKDRILIGRSRRAGYGGNACIEWKQETDREIQGIGKDGMRPISKDIPASSTFRVLLMSPYIGRNPKTGQINPSWLLEELRSKLNGYAQHVRTRWAFAPIGGFNRKWRLETPQALAAVAGTVVVFEAQQDISFDTILGIEHEGIGERKAEGFGRVTFLDAPLKRIYLYKPKVKSDSTDLPKELHEFTETPELVKTIEKRILDSEITKKIEDVAGTIAQSATRIPTNSLLGRLRTALRGDPVEGLKTLGNWLNEENEEKSLRQPAMDQLRHCRLKVEGAPKSLKEWLREMIFEDGNTPVEEKKSPVSLLLKFDVVAQQYNVAPEDSVIPEDSARKWLDEKKQALTVRLTDSVLAALALRNRIKERKDESE
jgi:CRISPR-associated protein Csx10